MFKGGAEQRELHAYSDVAYKSVVQVMQPGAKLKSNREKVGDISYFKALREKVVIHG